jgi:DNA-binding MarR family transcriptional regulator
VPETSALARLDRNGAATSSELARVEQISPQSMGATMSALEARGLVARDPDARDGRRVGI